MLRFERFRATSREVATSSRKERGKPNQSSGRRTRNKRVEVSFTVARLSPHLMDIMAAPFVFDPVMSHTHHLSRSVARCLRRRWAKLNQSY